MCVSYLRIYVCTTRVTGAHGDQKRALGPLGTGVKDGDEPCVGLSHCVCWESNLHSPQKQQMLLNTEPPLQLPFCLNNSLLYLHLS